MDLATEIARCNGKLLDDVGENIGYVIGAILDNTSEIKSKVNDIDEKIDGITEAVDRIEESFRD